MFQINLKVVDYLLSSETVGQSILKGHLLVLKTGLDK